jgi:hypothetical protein
VAVETEWSKSDEADGITFLDDYTGRTALVGGLYRVRDPLADGVKEDIAALRFMPAEFALFIKLGFNRPFIKRYIKDLTVREDDTHPFSEFWEQYIVSDCANIENYYTRSECLKTESFLKELQAEVYKYRREEELQFLLGKKSRKNLGLEAGKKFVEREIPVEVEKEGDVDGTGAATGPAAGKPAQGKAGQQQAQAQGKGSTSVVALKPASVEQAVVAAAAAAMRPPAASAETSAEINPKEIDDSMITKNPGNFNRLDGSLIRKSFSPEEINILKEALGILKEVELEKSIQNKLLTEINLIINARMGKASGKRIFNKFNFNDKRALTNSYEDYKNHLKEIKEAIYSLLPLTIKRDLTPDEIRIHYKVTGGGFTRRNRHRKSTASAQARRFTRRRREQDDA